MNLFSFFSESNLFFSEGSEISENYNISSVMTSSSDVVYYDIQTQLSDFLNSIGIYKYSYNSVEVSPEYAHSGRVASLVVRGQVI